AMNTMLDAPEKYRGAYVFLLILLYSIQIYADFTGGIDITIGIAEALGIRVTENFDRPFSSTSTKEYWRRWHITMGTWFTDYIFYPISVCRPMMKLSTFSRKHLGIKIGKRVPVYLATIVTWFLTGLWHGAGWNFIVWGLLNCLVILVSQELEPLYKTFHACFPKLASSRLYHDFGAIRTFLLMGLIRSLDCYRNVGTTFSMWGSMLTVHNIGELFSGGILRLGLSVADFIVVGVGILLMFTVGRMEKKGSIRAYLAERPVRSAALACALLAAIILFGSYGIGYDAQQFIYNQF
ncbi:MAG: MBOAT family protein, partial [Clostridia bacterium]|nr:MBOAT family protein [Clostridia bacterium]